MAAVLIYAQQRGRPGWRTARGRAGRRRIAWPGRSSTPRRATRRATAAWCTGRWTAGLLAGFLAERFRLALSAASVRRYLHAAGWRWGRPRLEPATHAPGAQKTVDPAAPFKLRLIEAALASAATVLYPDESELQLLPLVRSLWMKGPRPRIPTPGQNAKRTLFGALDARTGALVHLVRARERAADFVESLERLVLAYPSGEVVLVLDNVITHDARLVRQWLARPEHARFRLLWLPKYAAHEHNPIERVWGLLKDKVAANRRHGSIDALVAEAERFLAEARLNAPHPATLAAAAPTAEAA